MHEACYHADDISEYTLLFYVIGIGMYFLMCLSFSDVSF